MFDFAWWGYGLWDGAASFCSGWLYSCAWFQWVNPVPALLRRQRGAGGLGTTGKALWAGGGAQAAPFAVSWWAVWAVPSLAGVLGCRACPGGCPQPELCDTALGPCVQAHTRSPQLAPGHVTAQWDALHSIIWDIYTCCLKFEMSWQRLCCVQGMGVKCKLLQSSSLKRCCFPWGGNWLCLPVPCPEGSWQGCSWAGGAQGWGEPLGTTQLPGAARRWRGAPGSSCMSLLLLVVVALGEAVCGSWWHCSCHLIL